jgi:hypothetical protein
VTTPTQNERVHFDGAQSGQTVGTLAESRREKEEMKGPNQPHIIRENGERVPKQANLDIPLAKLVERSRLKRHKGKKKVCGNISVCTEMQPQRALLQPIEEANLRKLHAIQTKLEELGMPNEIGVTKWETLESIVDSGATVPVMHPNIGSAYEMRESAASLAGVEYEVANNATIPNMGEKHMAVITQEGSVRGYGSQCSEVGPGKALQSVRALGKSGHAVCFNVGPNGDENLIINRATGEVNQIHDDGLNYIQKLIIVPPAQVSALMEMVNQGYGDVVKELSQGFVRRGR